MPSLYVGTYGKYNSGSIEGKWLNLEDYADRNAFYEACQELHGPGEHEFMFQDYEDMPRHFYSECSISEEFWDYMNYEDSYDGKAKAAYVDLRGEWDEDNFEEAFNGEHDSELDFAYYLVDELGYLNEMPADLQMYFDYEAFARDLFINDYTFADGFVFRDL